MRVRDDDYSGDDDDSGGVKMQTELWTRTTTTVVLANSTRTVGCVYAEISISFFIQFFVSRIQAEL